MSGDGERVVRSFWDAWNRGDEEAAMTRLHRDVVFVDWATPESVGETFRGRAETIAAWARWAEPWSELRSEILEIVEDGDRVVSVHRMRGRARHSEIEVETRCAYAWTIRAGVCVCFECYPNRSRALRAAGLRERG